MPVTPASLVRHELVGLSVSVVAADNADLLDVQGEVVLETTKTVGIREAPRASENRTESGDGSGADGSERVSHVPKDGTTFAFTLPSGEVVEVEGRRLVGRPARRTENTGVHTWR
ncbi:MAG: ribonuclease P protein subunit [Haloarculaceae archaeon]